MKHKRNLVIGIILSATVAFGALQTVNAPSPQETIPSYEGCAYTWAYHDAPEVTKKLDSAVKVLNPKGSATATLFGEDCTYADGTNKFVVMQTDFKIHLPADDLTKHEEFGDWMSQVMQIITDIPREELPGNYGFVGFLFEKSKTENITIRVPIQKYIDEAKDKSELELFDYFYQP